MSKFAESVWCRMQTVPRLRTLADGMPYRWESSKAEIVDWLLEYNPDAVRRAMAKEESS